MSRKSNGFSLVEALVALAIIAAVTGALANTIAVHARTRAAMAQRRTALMVAQSALARVATGDQADDGQSGDLAWHVERQPYDAGGQVGAGQTFATAVPLEHISVTVEDATHHSLVTLQTIRIMR